LENQVTFQLHLGFHWRSFPQNSYFALPACAIKHEVFIAVSHFRALSLDSHVNIFVLISASVGGTFLNIHTYHSLRMRHKLCRFGCDRSLIKGTLLGKLSTYSALPLLAMEGFFLKFISRNFRARSTNEVSLVVLGHYLRGILLGE